MDPRTPAKAPSLTLIEDPDVASENDHCRWVRLMLDEELCSPEEVNKENIFCYSGPSTGSEKAAGRALLAGAVIY